jgi:hypothetical protein
VVVERVTNVTSAIQTKISPAGLTCGPQPAKTDWLLTPLIFSNQSDLVSFLGQLVEEGFADETDKGVFISWDAVFQLFVSTAYQGSLPLLALPPVEAWRPILSSNGSLTDTNFSISLSGWITPEGRPFAGNVSLEGPVLRAGARRALLPEEAWKTVQAVAAFHAFPREQRTAESNRRDWAEIRRHAMAANASLSDFLKKTIVLTPQRLQLALRKENLLGSKLVEVIPGFEGAPPRWMEIYDRFPHVRDHYEIPDRDGLCHVLVSQEVKTVLREIKRMPGRRVAGERAEAFIRNPFALLGPDAEQVIDPGEFEQARDDAGIGFSTFQAQIRRSQAGLEVALLIQECAGGEITSCYLPFPDSAELEKFINKLEERLARSAQCIVWQGYELEILGDTPDQLNILKEALADWRGKPCLSLSELFDLSHYSERIEEIGTEKPYYSPFIARKNEDTGWFPDNVVFGLYFTPEGSDMATTLAFTPETLDNFRRELNRAQEAHRESFSFQSCPTPIKITEAEKMLSAFDKTAQEVEKKAFSPNAKIGKEFTSQRTGLVIKPNVEKVDYEERRGGLETILDEMPRLPEALKAGVILKQHQLKGIARLQGLWSVAPRKCRGALLADDMGLGKTLQLLTFMARIVEECQGIEPFLVVAPVSLLENWKEEIEKFFMPGLLPVLTLYGGELSSRRLPRQAIEQALVDAGITRLLKDGWRVGARIVLTTYETLRDLEFSLGREKWAVMVCDEAQKIKNPNAMVTRAAKKQNATFKIACTGTPVENNLADLWSIFDFIQPGLLGALNEFSTRYRKPIEAETEEEKERVEELRRIIEPQTIRRTKADVIRDLPQKILSNGCRSLPISDQQRLYYANAIRQFRQQTGQGDTKSRRVNQLGLLQYLRRICSDPRPLGQINTDQEPLAEILKHSPKMSWLIQELNSIKTKDEKAIIFCEFRDLQRTLKRVIAEQFNFIPDIINGETSASTSNAASRQKRIKAFQERSGFGAIILSPLAVGFGVNIQAANHVLHFTRHWNPAKEDQATDRAYRIGQTKDVYVHCPVVVAHDFMTFDAKLDKLLNWKRELSHDMLNGTGELSPGDFNDIEDIGGGKVFTDEFLTSDDILAMDPDYFETFCTILWGKHGYSNVYRTPRAGDGGVDIVAIKDMSGVLIQCKSSSCVGQELGWEAIKDVVAGTAAYAAKHSGVSFRKIAVTNQKFNSTARLQAKLNHVELADHEVLKKMLTAKPVSRSEVDVFYMTMQGFD